MTIKTTCLNCEKELIAFADALGKMVKCSYCQAIFDVPRNDILEKAAVLDSEMILQQQSKCPHCLEVLQKIPSRKTRCVHCRQVFYVRTRPSDRERVIVTQKGAETIEKAWSELYEQDKREQQNEWFFDSLEASRLIESTYSSQQMTNNKEITACIYNGEKKLAQRNTHKLYRIHFGFSTSNLYPQAVELVDLAYKAVVRGCGEDIWHIASFTEEQIDLMAALYKIARKLPGPKIYGTELLPVILNRQDYVYDSQACKDRVRYANERLKSKTSKNSSELREFLERIYSKPYQQDMAEVRKRLQEDGYLEYRLPSCINPIKATKIPKEPIPEYQAIRDLISQEKYGKAIQKYYEKTKGQFYSELHDELIYLKRLAQIPLIGRDLLYFRKEGTRNELINANILEYCLCIDAVLEQYKANGFYAPLDIIINNAPTMEGLIEKWKHDYNGVLLCEGKVEKQPKMQIDINSFGALESKCPEGRLFDRYPDQVRYCQGSKPLKKQKYAKLWTTYSTSYCKRNVFDKGLHVNYIEAYKHKLWNRFRCQKNIKVLRIKPIGACMMLGLRENLLY